MDVLKFTCPKCAHDVVRRMARSTLMRCANKKCDFIGQPKEFNLDKRPSLKWDEATPNYGDRYE